MNRYRYRRTKESKRREMETLLRRLEEKRLTSTGEIDKEIGQLIDAFKKHLSVKDENVTARIHDPRTRGKMRVFTHPKGEQGARSAPARAICGQYFLDT